MDAKRQKQVLYGVLVVGLLGAIALGLFIAFGKPGSLAPPDIDSPNDVVNAADLSQLPTAEETAAQSLDEAAAQERTDVKEEKASNYSVRYASADLDKPDNSSFVEFYSDSGLQVTNYRNLNGEVADARNMTWGIRVDAKLTKPLSELQGHEMAVITSEEPLGRGEGYIKGATLLYVDGDVVVEALNVTLTRDWEPQEGDESLEIAYKGGLTCKWESPISCELKYTLRNVSGAITFSWDPEKKIFVDPTGAYSELEGKLRH